MAEGREREGKGWRYAGSNAAKLATSGAMVCGAVKYKPEGEGGQEEEEKERRKKKRRDEKKGEEKERMKKGKRSGMNGASLLTRAYVPRRRGGWGG